MLNLFLATLFTVGLGVLLIHSFFEIKRWRKKWPPIDDDEFMRRLPVETNREIALRVRRIVSEQLGVEYERVYPEQRFVEDLDCV